ncbi:glycosyltransferase [Occultella kanbiaonis]|uniref:glycosyltransferase n=1 Tax=Occultella kanbiaonis TaxID=2675754 RepID=UPI00143D1DF9|nr:glycosyltransferase [Occultella kanbiaonis]
MTYRILQISGTATGGGWFVDQVSELARRGHQVETVVTGDGPLKDRLETLGVKVHVIPFRGYRPGELWRVWRAYRHLAKLIRDGEFDVVHAHLYKTIIVCRTILRGRARPALISQVAGTVHLQSPVLSAIDRATMRWDTTLVASCTDFAETYQRLGARNVRTNFYGCHTDAFTPSDSPSPFREEFSLGISDIGVGMVAHMYPTTLRAFQTVGVKGHETFIDAAAILAERYDSLRFFVVGDEFSGDGSYRRTLQQRADKLVSTDRLQFLGHRTDMRNVLSGLDILSNPSLSESASYTMIEAALMEKPVVATRVGGLKDTVLDGRTGRLVDPADASQLAEAIGMLIEDANLRREFGRTGRRHVLGLFDIHATVDVLEEIYADTIDGVRP